MIQRCIRFGFVAACLSLSGCGYSADADRAYIHEKCAGQGAVESDAYRACAWDVMRYLEQVRRFRSTG